MILPPRHGTSVDAFRPACASWMPATAPCSWMKLTIGAKAAACSCDQIPLSQSVMRPSGETPLASTITSPAPPTARLPRCTTCHMFGRPRSDEYWHIGETKTRLRQVTERNVIGSNRCGMFASQDVAEEESVDERIELLRPLEVRRVGGFRDRRFLGMLQQGDHPLGIVGRGDLVTVADDDQRWDVCVAKGLRRIG